MPDDNFLYEGEMFAPLMGRGDDVLVSKVGYRRVPDEAKAVGITHVVYVPWFESHMDPTHYSGAFDSYFLCPRFYNCSSKAFLSELNEACQWIWKAAIRGGKVLICDDGNGRGGASIIAIAYLVTKRFQGLGSAKEIVEKAMKVKLQVPPRHASMLKNLLIPVPCFGASRTDNTIDEESEGSD